MLRNRLASEKRSRRALGRRLDADRLAQAERLDNAARLAREHGTLIADLTERLDAATAKPDAIVKRKRKGPEPPHARLSAAVEKAVQDAVARRDVRSVDYLRSTLLATMEADEVDSRLKDEDEEAWRVIDRRERHEQYVADVAERKAVRDRAARDWTPEAAAESKAWLERFKAQVDAKKAAALADPNSWESRDAAAVKFLADADELDRRTNPARA